MPTKKSEESTTKNKVNSNKQAKGSVLWCHSHFLLSTGGTKYIYEVAKRMNKEREVIMVVERASDYWKERYKAENIKLIEISKSTSTSKLYWLAFPLHMMHDKQKLEKIINDVNPKYLVSSFFPFNALCSELGKKYGLRHVHLCYEPLPFFHDKEVQSMYPKSQQYLMKFLNMVYGGIDKRGVKNADQVLTLNDITANSVKETYNGKTSTPIFTGIDHSHFHPFTKAKLKDLIDKHDNKPIVIHSTDWSPIKRTDLALEIFAVAKKKVDAQLFITSTIDNPDELEKFMSRAKELGVDKNIHYLGFLDYDDVPRYYSLAGVLLQTGTSVNSGATSMSLPVKEALACETAVIRSGATDEDVINDVSGYLVDPNNVEDVGNKLSELLSDPKKTTTFGKAGAKRMRELYTWENVVNDFNTALES